MSVSRFWAEMLKRSYRNGATASHYRYFRLRYSSTPELRPDGHIDRYLYQAVVNRLRDQHRRARAQRVEITQGLALGDEEMGTAVWRWKDDPCAQVQRQAFWEELQKIVGTENTVLLWQEDVAELPQAETALRLGMTTRTVRNRLDRARRRVRGNPVFCQDYEE